MEDLECQIFSYLIKDTVPVRYYFRKHAITDSSVYLKFSDLLPEDLRNLKKELKSEEDGTFTVREEYNEDIKLHNGKPSRFTGHLYFLIYGGSASTTAEFTAVAHSNRLGVFIGMETEAFDDILQGRDAQLEFALRLVRKSK